MILFLDLLDDEHKRNKFCVIHTLYQNLMFQIAYEVLHDPYLAEDAVQDAFLRIAKRFEMVGDPRSKRTKNLLCVTVKRTSIDNYNKEKNASVVYLEDYAEVSFSSLEWSRIKKMESKKLKEALNELPKIYSDVMILYYLYNYSQAEVAAILNVKPFTVRKRVERAKLLLKESLDLSE